MPQALPTQYSVAESIGQSAYLCQRHTFFICVYRIVGDIYLLGSPLNDEFTNLHRHAMFFPLMYRISALSKEMNENLYYSLNEPTLAINVDSVSRNMIYKLKERRR
jgi:hypothetical protein